MILLLSSILGTVILVLAVWLYAILIQNREFLTDQMEQKELTILNLQAEIRSLTRILASRDPMTYQILSAPTTDSLNSNEPVVLGMGSDEDEYKKWAILTGKIDADAADEDDDISDDLRLLGFSGA